MTEFMAEAKENEKKIQQSLPEPPKLNFGQTLNLLRRKKLEANGTIAPGDPLPPLSANFNNSNPLSRIFKKALNAGRTEQSSLGKYVEILDKR